MRDRMNPTTNASTALRPGNTPSDPVAYSRNASRLLMSVPSNSALTAPTSHGPGWVALFGPFSAVRPALLGRHT
jgi:hypothetical protein